jgi:hypothetical protein
MDLAHPPSARDREYDRMRVLLNEMTVAWKSDDADAVGRLIGQADRFLDSIWERRMREGGRR